MDFLTVSFALFSFIVARDEGGEAALMPLALCLSGFIYFGIMYSRYRNADKRHSHESETVSEVVDLKGFDQLIEHRTRLSNASMRGANDSQIEGALNKGGSFIEQTKRISQDGLLQSLNDTIRKGNE